MTTDLTAISAANDPVAANAAVLAAITADNTAPELPTIPPPNRTFDRLPAGLLLSDGSVVKDFEVRELNGEHEERMSRVIRDLDPALWVQTLLECGVVSIGGVAASPDVLKNLLIGDRDYLALAVRTATFGPDIEYGDLTCPKCHDEFRLTLELSDIPIREFDPSNRQFDLLLKSGRKVTVRLPDGSDQLVFFEDSEATDAERKTRILERCVLDITQKSGERSLVAGMPSYVKTKLNIPDREEIVSAINEKQAGPRYNEVTYKHQCGHELNVAIGVMHLFPGV